MLAPKLEVRVCPKHKSEPYSGGCRTCLTLYCEVCVRKLDLCTDGELKYMVRGVSIEWLQFKNVFG